MKPYLAKALWQFDNVVPSTQQDSPYPHTQPKYGAKEQFAEYDTSPPIGELTENSYVWQGCTMLMPLSALVLQQFAPTTKTMKQVQQCKNQQYSFKEKVT